MSFNINEIRSNLKFGGARPTLFQVQITNPINNSADLVAPFLIQATSLPSSSIQPIEVGYFGRKIKVAGDRSFEAWPVTVMNDEDFKVRHALELWHNQINSMQTNLNKNPNSSPALYKSTAVVTQFGKGGDALRRYRFNGIFPTDISSIELSWDAVNTIEQFSVTFAYDWFDVDGKTGVVA